ncbi:deoxyuridine 5'-triphosphate nucleotidohydrolase [Myxococcus phage Mx9]|nr:deoxyuridine 5'-triphosphate nucleotidohydrolase [Myxococcus phage Mx9]
MTCVKVKRIGNHTLPLPRYETEGAAGFDLRAHLKGHPRAVLMTHPDTGIDTWCLHIRPQEHVEFPCGFAFEVPEGFELQVRPRSGMGRREVLLWNGPGTVDSDYRGAVGLALWNIPESSFLLWEGERVAQGVIAPVARAELVEVDTLSETARGANGFGSTGTGAGEVAP